MVSNHSLASEYVQKEISTAREHGIPVYPVYIESVRSFEIITFHNAGEKDYSQASSTSDLMAIQAGIIQQVKELVEAIKPFGVTYESWTLMKQ